jgi:hypothetical protein
MEPDVPDGVRPVLARPLFSCECTKKASCGNMFVGLIERHYCSSSRKVSGLTSTVVFALATPKSPIDRGTLGLCTCPPCLPAPAPAPVRQTAIVCPLRIRIRHKGLDSTALDTAILALYNSLS